EEERRDKAEEDQHAEDRADDREGQQPLIAQEDAEAAQGQLPVEGQPFEHGTTPEPGRGCRERRAAPPSRHFVRRARPFRPARAPRLNFSKYTLRRTLGTATPAEIDLPDPAAARYSEDRQAARVPMRPISVALGCALLLAGCSQ